MKTQTTIYGLLVTGLFALVSLMPMIAIAVNEQQEMLDAYAEQTTQYITDAIADLKMIEEQFAEEKNEFLEGTTYNDQLLSIKQQQVQAMKDLLKAIRSADMDAIKEIEAKQVLLDHKFNMVGMEKDMICVMGDLKKRANKYPVANPAHLNESVKQLEATYYEMLEREENVFSQTQQLKQACMRKEELLSECEKCFEAVDTKK
ncbi:MAG: hypothetical protein C4541_01860 [Candidatus Auribacter fodinae]|jgi:uncharacterized membrane protein YfhO|uniref:Uncharacterized protein n=1 Tax=Candidatus Auribacter fodinae TaxID=2093366 RepID=A0A3A4RA10_9BACT|nr:MAG: hypothetical protein C4541_01860 [Candidatus Auribacter fodinae]